MYITHSRLLLVILLGMTACTSPVVVKGDPRESVVSDAAIGGLDASIQVSGPDSLTAIQLAMDTNVADSAGAEAPLCAVVAVAPQMLYPEVMIVQDISGSMEGMRWTSTKAALVNLAETLDSRLRLGLYVFPQISSSFGDGCQLEKFSAGNYVHVAPDLGTAPKIKTVVAQVDRQGPNGATPTAEALAVVQDYFRAHSTSPAGTPKYVVLLTDGSPNCSSTNPSTAESDSQAAALAQIQSLRADGTVTYVVGYEILSKLRIVMNQWASAGGGFTKYINVIDQQTLSSALSEIASAVIPCEYQVDTTLTNLSYVRVQLDSGTLKLNDTDGWTVVGNRVHLQGSACSLLRDGRPHALKIQVECAPVVVEVT